MHDDIHAKGVSAIADEKSETVKVRIENVEGGALSAWYDVCIQSQQRKRIPFEVSVDPFYSESNMNYLRSIVADIESGKAKLVERDLIED